MRIINNLKLIVKNWNWILILILLVSAILRLLNLGTAPPALTPDEAALGYNAYSIIHTGRDEFGKRLPIIFKSFGDYKPGLYVYLTAPFVAAFGLSEFSTRLPSALSGILIVWLIYRVCYIWFGKKTGYFAAFVAATNPYLIYFARGAWEANVSLMLTLVGINFFLKAIYKPRFLMFSAIFFALTLLTYQGAKLSTTIVLALLIISNWKNFWKIRPKYLVKSMLVGLIISIPIILSLFNGQAQRLTIFSIFSYRRVASEIQMYSDGFSTLFHSDQLNYLRMIMSRWFNFYSGKFLFFEGDMSNPIHTAPYQGVLLLIELLMLPIGLYAIFKNKLNKGTLFIFLWMILAPFSAAISRDQTNAVRSLNAAIPLVIIISFGLNTIVSWVARQRYIVPYYMLLATFYIFSLAYFLDAYFIHLPIHNSNYWRYGYKEAVVYVSTLKSKYKDIVFQQSYNQPYIYFLFYQKYDPIKYQKQANLVKSEYKGDVGFQTRLDNIRFERVDWSALQFTTDTLVVTGPVVPAEVKNNPKKYPIIHEIKYLNKVFVAFDIIEVI